MIPSITKEDLRARLKAPLPGKEAHVPMLPYRAEAIKTYKTPENFKLSAVMVLLYPDVQRQIRFVLMQRPAYDGVHGNQVSFPGGKMEKSDANLAATALRECEEETGIPGANIEIIGQLSEIFIPPSGFLVQPYVGWLAEPPVFYPDEREVAALFEVHLHDLLDPGSLGQAKVFVRTGNFHLDTPCFHLHERVVWGATCAMLNELRLVVLKV